METINTSAPWGGEGVSSIQTSIPRAPALETLSCSYCRCFSLRNRIKDDTEGENQKRSYTAAPGKHGRVSMCLNTILSYHPLHLIWSVNEMLFQLGARVYQTGVGKWSLIPSLIKWKLLLLRLLLLSRFSHVRLLCDPIDGSPPGSPVPGILQARTLEWVAISFSNA